MATIRNGVKVEKQTNRITYPMLQDVNKGWLQIAREQIPEQVLKSADPAVKIKIGKGGDYENLDAAVHDVLQMIDPVFREEGDLIAIIGSDLLAHDKSRLYAAQGQTPTEKERIEDAQVIATYGGNWLRQTDGKIQDKAIERQVEALDNREQYQSHTSNVDDHSTESVGGTKTLEALGALKLLSGGAASLAAVDDLNQATGRDLNLVVGQKLNATIGGDLQERIEGLRRSVAGKSQRLQAPKTWLGSEGVNVLQVLCDLLDLVQQMNIQLASHTHVPGPVPRNSDASDFKIKASEAAALAIQLRDITL
nr:P2 family phage major capsid protein [Pseudomonas taiwanensis]